MEERVATKEIYEDMAANSELCQVVKTGTGYQVYIFDGKTYIPFDTKMKFEQAYKCLDALRTAIVTIADDNFNSALLRDSVVQLVLHNSNRIFRRDYKKGYAQYKNTDEINPILRALTLCNDLQLTMDKEIAESDSNETIKYLEKALSTKSTKALSQSDFEDIKAEYEKRVQTSGFRVTRR